MIFLDMANSYGLPFYLSINGLKKMKLDSKNLRSGLLCLLIFLISIVVLVKISAYYDHSPVYVIDDPYIHMAIAKNVVQYGVFGVTPYEFTSTTSSPGWCLLLIICFKIFGVKTIIPLILNIIFSSIMILTISQILKKKLDGFWTQSLILMFFILCLPMPALTFTGMEHTAHALAMVLLLKYFYDYLTKETDKAVIGFMLFFAFVAVALRYESIFLVFWIGLISIINKKYKVGLAMWVVGSIPVFIMGYISLHNGWEFFPNSLLLKANINAYGGFVSKIKAILYISLLEIAANPALMVLIAFNIIVLVINLKDKAKTVFITSVLLATFSHLQFARFGWFYRYEAYLIAILIVTLLLTLDLEQIKKYFDNLIVSKFSKPLIVVLILVTLSPLLHRGFESYGLIARASHSINGQHIQMARFIEKYYTGRSVALNDIGAVCYFADIKLIDLWGLASREVCSLKRANKFDSTAIGNILDKNKVELIIAYEDWFQKPNNIPNTYKKIGSWKIFNNAAAAFPIVYFYSPNQEDKIESAKSNLFEFEKLFTEQVESSIFK